MASKAMKIKSSGGSQKPKSTISQTLPASFYKNYVPPATPKINPQPAKMDLPAFDALPKTSPNKQPFAPSSLKDTQLQYPMSMPAHRGLMMGPHSTSGTPFRVQPFSSGDKKQEPDIIEEEESKQNDVDSLVEDTKKMTVGSLTIFQMMSGPSGPPLKSSESSPDNKDVASTTSQQTASTFAEENDVAPEPSDEEDADEGLFDME